MNIFFPKSDPWKFIDYLKKLRLWALNKLKYVFMGKLYTYLMILEIF